MDSMRSLSSLAMIIGIPLLAACSAPYNTPSFASRPQGQTDFPGIAQLVAEAPAQTLDVLLVHGMCTHDEDWAQTTIARLNTMLRGTGTPDITETAVEGSKAVLFQANLNVPDGTVRTSALVWSPMVAPLKNQLCYDQTNKSGSCKAAGYDTPEHKYPYERASLNRRFKDSLLDDCLADAIIYQGESRNAISEQVQKAIITAAATPGGRDVPVNIAKAAAAETSPLVVISESLGSKIAFDAVYKLATDKNPELSAAGRSLFARTSQIFMGANQMPVLALADQLLEGEAKAAVRAGRDIYPPDPLAALIGMKQERKFGAAVTPPRVVAYTDPNDLLSFILVPAKQTAPYAVVDVIVSNDNTYLGLFEDPLRAHQGYRDNAEVMRLIACGSPSGASCKR